MVINETCNLRSSSITQTRRICYPGDVPGDPLLRDLTLLGKKTYDCQATPTFVSMVSVEKTFVHLTVNEQPSVTLCSGRK